MSDARKFNKGGFIGGGLILVRGWQPCCPDPGAALAAIDAVNPSTTGGADELGSV